MDTSEMIDGPSRARETAAVQVLAQSAIARAMQSVMRHSEAAARTSRIGLLAARIAAEWQRIGQPARRRAGGTVVITAALTHVALVALQQPPVSWQWLVLPGIALAQGAVLLLASTARPQPPS